MISKYFYYDESGNIFTSRTKALISQTPCFFHFHDDFYSSQVWSKEPLESLDQLYIQRAQQIREKYDYLVLCYSGGIDSTQILETFYYNNIHIDEIVMVGAFSQDSFLGSDENHNGEIYENCLSVLTKLHLPNTKISMLDYSKHFNDINNFTLIKQYGSDFYEHLGVRTSVSRLFWNDLDKYVNSPDNTGYIFGRDKPNMFYEQDTKRYGAYFTDYSYLTGVREKYRNGETVNFYTDPSCFDLTLKQYYTIMKYHQLNISEYDNYPNYYRLGHNYVRNIIYNLKNPLTYIGKKSTFTFLSNKDMFLVKNKSSDMYKIYADSLKKIRNNVDVLKTQPPINSKSYYI